MEEEWRPIKFNTNYSVSNYGRVKNNNNGRLLTTSDRKGYLIVRISYGSYKNYRVHRLVAAEFLGDIEDLVVNHIDGDKTNNRVDNLEIVTTSVNNFHAYETGLNNGRRTPVIQMTLDGEEIARFVSISEASYVTTITSSGIAAACKGKRRSSGGYKWKYESRQYEIVEEPEGKHIDGYDNKYIVTKDGKVYGCFLKQYMNIYLDGDGYYAIALSKHGVKKIKLVHRLVAQAYIPNPDPENKIFVNHKDLNKANNHVDNLEWVTPSENSIHAITTRLERTQLSVPSSVGNDTMAAWKTCRYTENTATVVKIKVRIKTPGVQSDSIVNPVACPKPVIDC